MGEDSLIKSLKLIQCDLYKRKDQMKIHRKQISFRRILEGSELHQSSIPLVDKFNLFVVILDGSQLKDVSRLVEFQYCYVQYCQLGNIMYGLPNQ